MTKTRDNYQIQANTLPELILGLNLLLQRLADRMDKMEGIRGTAEIESNLDMNNNQITELQGSVLNTDAVQKAELPDQGTSSSDSPTFVDVTITDDLTVNDDTLLKGDLTVNGATSFVTIAATGAYTYTDGNGTVIHSFATT